MILLHSMYPQGITCKENKTEILETALGHMQSMKLEMDRLAASIEELKISRSSLVDRYTASGGTFPDTVNLKTSHYQAFQQSGLPSIICSKEGSILDFNHLFLDTFGYLSNELKSLNINDIIVNNLPGDPGSPRSGKSSLVTPVALLTKLTGTGDTVEVSLDIQSRGGEVRNACVLTQEIRADLASPRSRGDSSNSNSYIVLTVLSPITG